MAPTDQQTLTSKLKDLALGQSTNPQLRNRPQGPIADSWEDDVEDDAGSSSTERDVNDNNDHQDEYATPMTTQAPSPSDSIPIPSTSRNLVPSNGVMPPPPTPSSKYGSPSFPQQSLSPLALGSGSPASSTSGSPQSKDARPEKTNAVANRMIAGALGVKAPKRTEEQKAYDKAMREKELRRRAEEKEKIRKEAEQREKAKQAIWDD